MRLCVQFLALFAVVGFSHAAAVIYELKEGETLRLNLGGHIYERKREGRTKETTIFCSPEGPASPNCGQWANEKEGIPGEVSVSKNGTLEMTHVTVADAGMYSSPDQKPSEFPRDAIFVKITKN